MLSGIEKIKLARELNQIIVQIKDPSTKGIEKIKLAKRISQIHLKITGKVTKVARISDLIAGKFNGLEPKKFITLVREIAEQENAFDLVKQPVVNYVNKKA